MEKELAMDSDEEKKFIQFKYRLPQRRKFREKELDDDLEDKRREEEKILPPEPELPKALIPQHTEEMEEE